MDEIEYHFRFTPATDFQKQLITGMMTAFISTMYTWRDGHKKNLLSVTEK